MKTKFPKRIGGLKLRPKDKKNFKLGAILKLPKLEELPEAFLLGDLPAKNQKDSDFCTAMMTTLMSEFQEEVELEPSFTFALSKVLSGDPEEWGQDLNIALKAGVEFGFLRQTASTLSLENSDAEFLRYIENWGSEQIIEMLKELAAEHAKKSYWEITGTYSPFDNMRAAIWHFRKEKRAVGIGVYWSWKLSDKKIDDYEDTGFGHALTIIGWSGDYAIVQNSYGENAGEKGRHLIHKRVIDHFAKKYGMYMYIDLPKGEAKIMNKWGISLKFRWLAKILSFFKNMWKEIWL